jgi:glycosyltransferase involved in cell wall biosynthesis
MRPGSFVMRQLRRTRDWIYQRGACFGGRIDARTFRRWRPQPSSKPGVNFVGPVEFLNGLGASARGYVACLKHAGIPVNVMPWRRGFERLQSIPMNYLSLEPQPLNIVHLNLDLLLAEHLLDVAPLKELVRPRRYNILIVYWELECLLPEWAPLVRSFDEVWSASSFVAHAAAAASARLVRIVRPALEFGLDPPRRSKADFGLPSDRFVFFYSADVGSVLGRKNPKALLAAYLAEFADDEGACCLIKIHYGAPGDPRMHELNTMAERRTDVVFIDTLLDRDMMRELYHAIDCYVSPHRSEGLGLTILEAMNAKKPVIATPYGGVTDFVNEETAMPLKYHMADVGENNLPYPATQRWADPEHASIRAALRAIFRDRGLARRLGDSGHRQVGKLFSPDNTAAAVQAEIQRIWTAATPDRSRQ